MTNRHPTLEVSDDFALRGELDLRQSTALVLWLSGAAIFWFGQHLSTATHSTELNDARIIAGLSLVFAFISYWLFELLSGRALAITQGVMVTSGSLVIGLAIYFSGGATSPYFEILFFSVLYTAYFLPGSQATIQTALACAVAASPMLYDTNLGQTTFYANTAVLLPVFCAMALMIWFSKREMLIAELNARRQAVRDQLTGLFNLRGFGQRAERAFVEANESGNPQARNFGILIVDIDDFKEFNSTFGYLGGDTVLRIVAGALSKVAGPDDCLARTGGDEFAAIVFHRDPSQVEEFAHDCAQAVADCKLPEQFGGAKISITVGTASYSDHVESVAELLMRADSRLMRRKHPVEPVEPTSNPQRRARPADGRSQSSNAFSAEDGVERRADRPGADLRGYASGVDDDGPNMMQSYVGVATWVAAAAVILFSLSLPGADRTYMTEVYWLTGVALVSAGVIFAISLWRFELSAVIGNVSAAIFLAIAIFYTGGSESQVLPVILFNVAFSAYFNPRLQAQLDVLLAIVVVASPLLYESASENQVYFMRFVVLASAAVVIALVVMRNKGELALAEKFSSDLARRDSLTGLDNRRAFHEQMSRELRRLEGDSRAGLALMMVDLDNFKNVNTLYGHAGGDLLLQAVADELRSAAREGDHVARVGGDEFALIARGASQMSVRSLADRCLGAVRTAVEREGFTDCDVSASVGYALAPLHGRTLDELVTAADTAVNHIKSTGKDATGEFDSTPHAI